MKLLVLFFIVILIIVSVLLFKKCYFSNRNSSETNDLYISLMQNLCDDEFVTTIGNSGFYELDNNLIVSTFLYRENKSPWKDKEVILLNITCALPIKEQDVFSERLKKNIEEWRGDAICTFQLGKTNAYFELDIRIPLDITEQKSLSLLYKRLISFLDDECGLSKVVRYAKSQIDEDIYYYEFIGMNLNRVAIFISSDNEWSSDMEDMHDTLSDINVKDSDFSSVFITSDEFEEVYSNIN